VSGATKAQQARCMALTPPGPKHVVCRYCLEAVLEANPALYDTDAPTVRVEVQQHTAKLNGSSTVYADEDREAGYICPHHLSR
jgi:hypothetical protein